MINQLLVSYSFEIKSHVEIFVPFLVFSLQYFLIICIFILTVFLLKGFSKKNASAYLFPQICSGTLYPITYSWCCLSIFFYICVLSFNFISCLFSVVFQPYIQQWLLRRNHSFQALCMSSQKLLPLPPIHLPPIHLEIIQSSG